MQHYETVQVVIEDHHIQLASSKQANAAEQHLLDTAQMTEQHATAHRAHGYASPHSHSSHTRSAGGHTHAGGGHGTPELSSELQGVTAVRQVRGCVVQPLGDRSMQTPPQGSVTADPVSEPGHIAECEDRTEAALSDAASRQAVPADLQRQGSRQLQTAPASHALPVASC